MIGLQNRTLPRLFVLLILVVFYLDNSLVLSCGMTTHNMVGRRAFNFSSFENYPEYQQYIENNYPTFDAGCAFPDFGYSCDGLAEESEAAHWPPFLRAGSEYLIETYNQPWSEDGIKLAVFLLGIASHQVADIPWHSIGGIQEGLIRAMSAQDFNFNYSVAHHNADDGGEFVLAYNYNLDWLSDEWYVPVTDMRNIFHRMNYSAIDDFNLLRCNALLYAGAMGVKIGGKFLYPEIAKKSIFLIDHYQDYYNGGLDDMAIWTSYCWPVLIGWMQGEKIGNFCLIQPDPNNQELKDRNIIIHNDDYREDEIKSFNQQLKKTKEIIVENLIIEKKGSGYSISLPKDIKNQIKSYLKEKNTFQESNNDIDENINNNNIQIISKELLNDFNDQNNLNNFTSIQSETTYSYLGREMKSMDLNFDGFDDLIVSAPGYGVPGAMQTGCVYYLFSGDNSTLSKIQPTSAYSSYDINQLSNGKVCGNETHSRFGWSFEILDFNLDGVLDLIVGSPSSSNANLTYLGKVYIYFGEFSTEKVWSVPSEPSLEIYGSNFHDQAGNLVTSGDCNGDGNLDLILGTYTSDISGVETGAVTLFYSSENRVSGQQLDLNKDCDFQFYGEYDYEWFGYDIEVYTNPKGLSFILIGSPTFHLDNSTLMDTGRLFAYPLNPPSPDPIFTLYGVDQFDKVGYNFQVANASQFGLQGKYDNILVLSLPTKVLSEDLDQAGQVVLIDLTNLSGEINISSSIEILSFQGTSKYSRFGESLIIGKQLSTDQYPSLFIGAPLWTDSFDDTGPGIVFSFNTQDYIENNRFKGNEISKDNSKFYSLKRSSSSLPILNNVKDSRFGYRMVLMDINLDGKNDLVIGAARDSSKLLEGGSINIFISS